MPTSGHGASGSTGKVSAVAIATVGHDKILITKVDQTAVAPVVAQGQDVRIVVEGKKVGGHTPLWCACDHFTCGIL